jgi:hypothetical protein
MVPALCYIPSRYVITFESLDRLGLQTGLTTLLLRATSPYPQAVQSGLDADRALHEIHTAQHQNTRRSVLNFQQANLQAL